MATPASRRSCRAERGGGDAQAARGPPRRHHDRGHDGRGQDRVRRRHRPDRTSALIRQVVRRPGPVDPSLNGAVTVEHHAMAMTTRATPARSRRTSARTTATIPLAMKNRGADRRRPPGVTRKTSITGFMRCSANQRRDLDIDGFRACAKRTALSDRLARALSSPHESRTDHDPRRTLGDRARRHPEPGATDDQVLIGVHTAGVAFPEVLQSRGLYQLKPELPFVPGAEVAGVVRSAPDGARSGPGDRVAAFPGSAASPRRSWPTPDWCSRCPTTCRTRPGAAMPMNYLTVHFALVRRGAARGPARRCWCTAPPAASAPPRSSWPAPSARRVIAVDVDAGEGGGAPRRPARTRRCCADGFRDAREGADRRDGRRHRRRPGRRRPVHRLAALPRPEGRLLVIGFTGGEIPTVKVNRLLLNNISVVGVGWGAYARAPGPRRQGVGCARAAPRERRAASGRRPDVPARRGHPGAADPRRAPGDRQGPAAALQRLSGRVRRPVQEAESRPSCGAGR